MIYDKNGMIKFDNLEPAFRSCHKCNSCHEHLKNTKYIHSCFECGRYWINGHYLDEFKNNEEFYKFMKKCEKDGCDVKEE